MSAKKVLSLLLVTVLLLAALAGCTSNTPTPTPTDSPAAEASTQSPQTETPTPETEEPVTISFFHWKGEEKTTWDKIIEMFEAENSNIKVEMEILPEDQYYTTLQARIMAGEGLDVFEVNPGSRFASLLKADPYYDLTGQPFLDELTPSFIDCGQADGKQYIIPLSKSFVGLFYNVKIFEELSLEVPKTWEDFLAVCEAIKQSGIEVIATGAADSYTSTWPWAELIVEYSDDPDIYRKLAAGEVKFTDPLFKQILEPCKILADKGYWMKNATGTKYDTSLSLFATEKAAMLNNGTWAIGAIRQANPDLDFSIMLLPAPEGELVAGVAPAQAVCVSKTTQNPEASLKFLEFILSKEIMEIYGNETGQEVPNKNAILTDPDLASMAPIGAVGPIYPHYYSEWPEIDQDIISEIVTRAMQGEDVDTILQDAQSKLESLNIQVS